MRHEQLLATAEDILREDSIDLPLASSIDFILKSAEAGLVDKEELRCLAESITAGLVAIAGQSDQSSSKLYAK